MNTNKNPGSLFEKPDKADEGKQRKEVQEGHQPSVAWFLWKYVFLHFVVCCAFVCMSLWECVPMGVCTHVYMWMEARDNCVTFSVIVPLSFWDRLYCWIWTSPSWLATKLQESLRFCLLRTRIIGTCIALGFRVGAENLNSGYCDYIESTLCVLFLDLFISYVVAFWELPRETEPKGCVKCYIHSRYKTKHIC